MSRLAPAPQAYSRQDQQNMRNEIERRDGENYKRDKHLDMRPGTYIVMTDANGVRYSVTVNTSGVLVVTAL